MSRVRTLALAIAVSAGGMLLGNADTVIAGGAAPEAARPLDVRSPTFKEGAPISNDHFWNQFGCSGGNALPDLEWSAGPEGTQSYAITFYDHDAPTGSGFWHWVIYNIPTNVHAIKNGELPAGSVEGNTDLGKPGFFGPCPPKGRKHRYTFTVHALTVPKLDVEPGTTAALTGFFIHQNTIAKGELSGYGGPR